MGTLPCCWADLSSTLPLLYIAKLPQSHFRFHYSHSFHPVSAGRTLTWLPSSIFLLSDPFPSLLQQLILILLFLDQSPGSMDAT